LLRKEICILPGTHLHEWREGRVQAVMGLILFSPKIKEYKKFLNIEKPYQH
jgi:hypothetical protein